MSLPGTVRFFLSLLSPLSSDYFLLLSPFLSISEANLATLTPSLHITEELISTISPTLPIVVCGNKVDKDEKSREIDTGTLEWPSQMQGIQYYDISALTTLNLEAPFLWIMRQLLPEPTVVCIIITYPLILGFFFL